MEFRLGFPEYIGDGSVRDSPSMKDGHDLTNTWKIEDHGAVDKAAEKLTAARHFRSAPLEVGRNFTRDEHYF
jgi:hypothetical protein